MEVPWQKINLVFITDISKTPVERRLDSTLDKQVSENESVNRLLHRKREQHNTVEVPVVLRAALNK